MSDKPRAKINSLFPLVEAITQLSAKDQDGKPVYVLPFKFNYALAMTLKRIRAALEPVDERKAELLKEFRGKMDITRPADDAKPEALAAFQMNEQRELQRVNDTFAEECKEFIEFEPYRFPETWPDEDKKTIAKAGIPATILSELIDLGLSLGD